MVTHCTSNAAHSILSWWESQHAWPTRTASETGAASSHDSEMFLGTGWLLALQLEKENQSSQLRALSLMVTSVEIQTGFFVPLDKVEKVNGGQILKN